MLHRGILGLALALCLAAPAAAEYTFRPFGSGSGIGNVNGIVKGDGAGNPSQAVAGTDYLGPSLTNGRIYIGSVGNLATGVVMGGDCTIIAAGTITCTKTNGSNFGTMAVQNANSVTISGGSGAFGLLSSQINQNALTHVDVTNTTSGTAASASFNAVNNAGNLVSLGVLSSGFTPVGVFLAGRAYLSAATGVFGLAIQADPGPVVFASGGPAEVARFDTSGNLLIGATSGTSPLVVSKNQNALTSANVTNTNAGTTAAASVAVFNDAANRMDMGILSSGWSPTGALTAGRAYLAGGPAAGLVVNSVGPLIFAPGGNTERARFDTSGNFGIGTPSPGAGFHTTGTVRFAGIPSVATPGCLANDASGNISGGNACSGGGMPAGGARAQAPLNSAAGTALWRTEPFVNISALTGADCTGAVATVISTVIGSIKSIALPTDCTLKVTANDTIPAGVFFAVPCGARVQVDGSAVLTFNAQTDDNACQKFAATGAGGGTGTGVVKGLYFNRPEWWGAFGDCNYGGTCSHDDSGPVQQAFNSAQAVSGLAGAARTQVKFGCGAGYGISTAITATISRTAPLEISGCGPVVGGNSEQGSALIGRAGFTGSILTVATTGGVSVSTNFYVHDFNIRSYTAAQADTCLQIGAAGQIIGNNAGRNLIENLQIDSCKHSLKFVGKVDQVNVQRLWMNLPDPTANVSCVEASMSGTDYLADTIFITVNCNAGATAAATSICYNFRATGSAINIAGIRFTGESVCYKGATGWHFQADNTGEVADVWCYSCQVDDLVASGYGYRAVTTGSGIIANLNLDRTYTTSNSTIIHAIELNGTGGGTIQDAGLYGNYVFVASAARAIVANTGSRRVQIQGSKINGSYSAQGILVNDCTGCLANNNIFGSGSAPLFVLLGASTDYSQACNNSGSGGFAPGSTSASTATGTHNIYFGSGFQSCPNN